jgi:ABC-type lipoprotein release transport system permease subunit
VTSTAVLKLAWRNLRRNKRRTGITLTSIAFGCAFTIFIVALGAGVNRRTIHDATRMLAGNITIEDPKYRDEPAPGLIVPSVAKIKAAVATMPEVELVKPLCAGNGVVASASGAATVGFLGVEPEQEKDVSRIARSIVKGRFIASTDAAVKGVVIGDRLASRLHVDVGSKLVLTTTSAQGEVVQELLHVVGIFRLGGDAIDGRFIELPIAVSRNVMGLTNDQATEVGLVLSRPDTQDRVLDKTKRALAADKLAVYSWETLLPTIASWVRFGMYRQRVGATFILFIATFTILNTILMSVLERKHEFAMLLALGTPPRLLRIQVFVETLMLGFMGCALGLGFGGAIAYAAERHGIDVSHLMKDVPSVGGVPMDLDMHPWLSGGDALFVVAIVLTATTLIAIFPALRSTRVDVATALRSR